MPPGLLAERLGEVFFELPDAGVEAGGALVRGEQVSLQRRTGDGGTGGFACCGRACFQDMDLFEQVAVPVEERAVDAGGAGDARDADLAAAAAGLVERR